MTEQEQGERLIRFSDVIKLPWLPAGRGGRRLHTSTIFRWYQQGIKVGDERVRLRAVRVGMALATTERWLRDFFAALSDPGDLHPAVAAERRHADEAAESPLPAGA